MAITACSSFSKKLWSVAVVSGFPTRHSWSSFSEGTNNAVFVTPPKAMRAAVQTTSVGDPADTYYI